MAIYVREDSDGFIQVRLSRSQLTSRKELNFLAKVVLSSKEINHAPDQAPVHGLRDRRAVSRKVEEIRKTWTRDTREVSCSKINKHAINIPSLIDSEGTVSKAMEIKACVGVGIVIPFELTIAMS
jgi:hypothetical protein